MSANAFSVLLVAPTVAAALVAAWPVCLHAGGGQTLLHQQRHTRTTSTTRPQRWGSLSGSSITGPVAIHLPVHLAASTCAPNPSLFILHLTVSSVHVAQHPLEGFSRTLVAFFLDSPPHSSPAWLPKPKVCARARARTTAQPHMLVIIATTLTKSPRHERGRQRLGQKGHQGRHH